MRIKTIRLEALQIPLLVTHSQSNQEANYSSSILVVIETQQGIIGYGEACPRAYVTRESIQSVVKDIRSLRADLFNHSFSNLTAIRQFICKDLSIGNAAICGLELALLDAWSKETNTDLMAALGGVGQEDLIYSGIIPLNGSKASQFILKHFNFKSVKIKVGKDLEENCRKIKLLKIHYPHGIDIRVDANCGWKLKDALLQIPILKELGIASFEQIFPKKSKKAYQQVMEQFGQEVCILADESITSLASAKYQIKNKLCNGVNLKISKLGGIFRTLEIYKYAQSQNISCQLGAHFGETSILTAAGVLLSSLAPNLTYREGAFGTFLLSSDLCQQSFQMNQNGVLKLPPIERETTLGLGVLVKENLVKNYIKPLTVIRKKEQYLNSSAALFFKRILLNKSFFLINE